MQIAKLGIKSIGRAGKTGLAVYPRLMKCLLTWRKPGPRELRELFEDMGATYIKFGQFIASSPSLFPDAYVEEFQKLLDKTKPLPYSKIQGILQDELGAARLEELFLYIDRSPLASASVAQVHAAVLKDGREVVIKVQKPGVRDVMEVDLNVMFMMTRLFELIMPNVDKKSLTDLVEEMYQALIDECDFTKERAHLNEFSQFLKTSGLPGVTAPDVIDSASTQRVLTMTRLRGVNINNPDLTSDRQIEASNALFAALNAWFASLTQCEVFHADLHSGNLMLLDDGRAGFIDFGMVGRIKPEIWQAAFQLFSGLAAQDARQIAGAMAAIGMVRDSVVVDELSRDVESLLGNIGKLDQSALNDAAVTGLVTDLGAIGRRHGIRFPRSFMLLLKQFLYFDAYLKLLAPGADLFGDQRIRTQW